MTFSAARAALPASTHGTWAVGVEVGELPRTIGVFTGRFDEIAFKLANRTGGVLIFTPVDVHALDAIAPTGTKVTVALTHRDLTAASIADRSDAYREWLSDADVAVSGSCVFGGVELIAGKTEELRLAAESRLVRTRALAKLTHEEKLALGLLEQNV